MLRGAFLLLSLLAASCGNDNAPVTPTTPTPAPAPPPAPAPSPAPAPAPANVSLATLTLNPPTVQGQAPSLGTVTLTGAAPPDGALVSLSTNQIDVARVGSSVTVAAGATTATFTVDTATVLENASVTVSANYGGITRTANLMVTPPALVARFTVESPTVGADRCAIISSGGALDCVLTASNSSGAISQYLWTFVVAGRSHNKNTADGATSPDNTECDLFANVSHPGPSFAMEVVLQVVGRDGVSRSEPVRRTVAVVHNSFCGFS